MKRLNVVSAAIGSLVLLAALAVGFRWFLSRPPVLTVYLRCNGEVSGTLSVTTVLKNGEHGSEENFDLKTVCNAEKKVELQGYLSQENLQFVYKHNDGKTVELLAEYGRDIQRDQNGFYTVLKVMNASPFIANDRI